MTFAVGVVVAAATTVAWRITLAPEGTGLTPPTWVTWRTGVVIWGDTVRITVDPTAPERLLVFNRDLPPSTRGLADDVSRWGMAALGGVAFGVIDGATAGLPVLGLSIRRFSRLWGRQPYKTRVTVSDHRKVFKLISFMN